MLEEKTDGENREQEEVQSFQDLFEASMGASSVETGEIVTGRVVSVANDLVTVDIGYKSEGLIPLREFCDSAGNVSVAEGDEIEVFVVSTGASGGELVLSFRRARQASVWKAIEHAYNTHGYIEGKVTGKVKGGLAVDVGVTAFLPGSHVDIRPTRGLDRYIGETHQYSVLKFNRARGNVVVSRKALLEKERAELMGETLKILEEGVVLEGTVKNVTDYGAFVDLGGLDGLLHVTDMSWGRVNRPSDVVKPGDVVKVVVLKYDPENARVSLGMKQLHDDPWTSIADRLFPGSKVRGKVVSVADYGAFVEIEDGVEGLVHVSEMSWTSRVSHPSKLVSVGDEVLVVVLGLDPENRRISLGLKQATPNPWEQLPIDHPVGSHLSGKVSSVTDFGFFVTVADGIDGLVHISDMHWTRKVKHPSEVVSKGDEVEVVVLAIDSPNERLSLGLKQISEDPWSAMQRRHPVGSRIQGKVTNVTDFGVFVEIEEGVEGMIHVSELSTDRVEDPREFISPGASIEAEVLQLDQKERRVALSAKSVLQKSDQKEIGQYMSSSGGGGSESTGSAFNLGEMISAQLEQGRKGEPESPAGDEEGGKDKVAEDEAVDGEADTVADSET
ncbi:MAG: 30S ribosomal protein S1 [Candidatus Binatia bacterium]